MFDLEASILASCGLGPKPEPIATVPLDGAAEDYRNELLGKLERAKASIDILASTVRLYPMSRTMICALTGNIMTVLGEAGQALDGLDLALDCRGAA